MHFVHRCAPLCTTVHHCALLHTCLFFKMIYKKFYENQIQFQLSSLTDKKSEENVHFARPVHHCAPLCTTTRLFFSKLYIINLIKSQFKSAYQISSLLLNKQKGWEKGALCVHPVHHSAPLHGAGGAP